MIAAPQAPSHAPARSAGEDARAKVLRKCAESVAMSRIFFEQYADEIDRLAHSMAKRFSAGGKLLTMGNGGSLADALHFAVEFTHPIIEKRSAYPVIPLMTDIATLTAIGNDLDYSQVFVNQIKVHGRPGDMALAVSTSGKSPNLIYALEEAKKRGLLTIAWAGKDGGRFPEVAEHCFVVPSYSIHRIQEVHATLVHILWDMIHIALGAEDVV
jgi:D-sedoheptulose 7-phosphate isomerase